MKTLIKKTLIPTLAFLAMTSTAYANNPYLLGQLGAYKRAYDWKQVDLTGRVAAGYQWDTALIFGKHISEPSYLWFNYGLELGYQNYATAEETSTYSAWRSINTSSMSYHRQTVDLLAVLDILPTPCLDMFVKLGPAFAIEKLTHSNSSYISGVSGTERTYSYTYHSNRFVPKVIAGLGYNVTPNINVNLAFAHEFETNSVGEFSSVMAGIKYDFL